MSSSQSTTLDQALIERYESLPPISDCLPIELGTGDAAHTLSVLELICNTCRQEIPQQAIRGNIGRVPGGKVTMRGVFHCSPCDEYKALNLHLNDDLSISSIDAAPRTPSRPGLIQRGINLLSRFF